MAEKKYCVKKAEAAAKAIRDAKGRFISANKAEEAPKTEKKATAPKRDSKGRFIKAAEHECKCGNGGCCNKRKEKAAPKKNPFRPLDFVWFQNPNEFGTIKKGEHRLGWIAGEDEHYADAVCMAIALSRHPLMVLSIKDDFVTVTGPAVEFCGLSELTVHNCFLKPVNLKRFDMCRPLPIITLKPTTKKEDEVPRSIRSVEEAVDAIKTSPHMIIVPAETMAYICASPALKHRSKMGKALCSLWRKFKRGDVVIPHTAKAEDQQTAKLMTEVLTYIRVYEDAQRADAELSAVKEAVEEFVNDWLMR